MCKSEYTLFAVCQDSKTGITRRYSRDTGITQCTMETSSQSHIRTKCHVSHMQQPTECGTANINGQEAMQGEGINHLLELYTDKNTRNW